MAFAFTGFLIEKKVFWAGFFFYTDAFAGGMFTVGIEGAFDVTSAGACIIVKNIVLGALDRVAGFAFTGFVVKVFFRRTFLFFFTFTLTSFSIPVFFFLT